MVRVGLGRLQITGKPRRAEGNRLTVLYGIQSWRRAKQGGFLFENVSVSLKV